MKKIILIVTVLMAVSFTGCGSDENITACNDEIFTPTIRTVYVKSNIGSEIVVLADEQNVAYIFYNMSNTMTDPCMMVNPDGTPKVWSENEDFDIECLEKQYHYEVYRDTSTNVLYLYTRGFMPMRNPDGSIKLYQETEN